MRTVVLLCLPAPLVAGCIVLADWARSDPHHGATRNEVRIRRGGDGVWLSVADASPANVEGSLGQRCEALALKLRSRLDEGSQVVAQPPFVIGGNLSSHELFGWHQNTIAPAVRALERDFFHTPPTEPITVLLFSDAATYRKQARRLFGQDRVSVYGYYKPATRTIVINLAAGGGTLLHELTHALIEFDFPGVPLWFNEGLGSLNEQCEIVLTKEGPVIEPLHNWRLAILQEAIARGRQRPTEELLRLADFHAQDEAVCYAHARYLCLYLWQHGALPHFYEQFRNHYADDPQGIDTLLRVLAKDTPLDLDHEFVTWVMSLSDKGSAP